MKDLFRMAVSTYAEVQDVHLEIFPSCPIFLHEEPGHTWFVTYGGTWQVWLSFPGLSGGPRQCDRCYSSGLIHPSSVYRFVSRLRMLLPTVWTRTCTQAGLCCLMSSLCWAVTMASLMSSSRWVIHTWVARVQMWVSLSTDGLRNWVELSCQFLWECYKCTRIKVVTPVLWCVMMFVCLSSSRVPCMWCSSLLCWVCTSMTGLSWKRPYLWLWR